MKKIAIPDPSTPAFDAMATLLAQRRYWRQASDGLIWKETSEIAVQQARGWLEALHELGTDEGEGSES